MQMCDSVLWWRPLWTAQAGSTEVTNVGETGVASKQTRQTGVAASKQAKGRESENEHPRRLLGPSRIDVLEMECVAIALVSCSFLSSSTGWAAARCWCFHTHLLHTHLLWLIARRSVEQ